VVRLVLSAGWAHRGRTEFEAGQGLLTDLIKDFAGRYPDYRHRLLDSDGEPLRYFGVYVDDYLIPGYERPTLMVADGSTVMIVPPMAGG
jgi:molybdopterin converting factor small subunit